ncbi:hypothetical protein EYF80_032291 [Liparis tanakae]|uniref:Uncharacterized protein n=1 Tax=Liparis tanakae TaxID=230148 RepID=A0A4Z2GV09_9TELE|nr:hypothetical protein EYF80_032291 [Liparis tanakae]
MTSSPDFPPLLPAVVRKESDFETSSFKCLTGFGVGAAASGGRHRHRLPWEAGMWETGRARESEGGHDCFTSSIIVTGFAPLALMAASQRPAVGTTERTTSVGGSKQNLATPPPPPFWGQSSRFGTQLQRKHKQVNDGVRGEEPHADEEN